MYNMIGTLIINCEKSSESLCNIIDGYISVISQSDALQNENIEKFTAYFNDKQCCDQFKDEFFDIDDFQKNDTLYTDASDNANNQYFVMLFIKCHSENPQEVVKSKWEKYQNDKINKMLSHKILTKSLRLKIKNSLLTMKNNLSYKQMKSLSMNEHSWVCLSDHGNIQSLIKEASHSKDLFPVIDRLFSLQSQLFNILNNHYTIRNSLDTHFVSAKLNYIEEVLLEARINLSQKIQEIEGISNQSAEESKEADESFNPFIEIGDNNEEVKFISLNDKREKLEEAVSQITENLKTIAEKLENTLQKWLNSMPEPEVQNIGAKQANLKRKLRWEKMLSSSAKVKQLQGIFRKLRVKKK